MLRLLSIKANYTILTLNKTDSTTKTTRDKKGQHMIIKGASQQKDITIVNIYARNMEVPKYIK